MKRLTKNYSGSYGLVKVRDNEQAVESRYPSTLRAIRECFERLGVIEDVLYAPDGAETISLEALRELVKNPKQASLLSEYSAEDLVQELSSRHGVKAFETGLYAPYELKLARRYAADRLRKVDVPMTATVLVVDHHPERTAKLQYRQKKERLDFDRR